MSNAREKTAERTFDRDTLRAAIRHLGDEYVFYILDDAIEILSPADLTTIVGRYTDLAQLPVEAPIEKNLLAEVRAFDAASRAGTYYKDFRVDSRNCMTRSLGTRAFIADCHRLLGRCVAEASKHGDPAEVREAFEVIFDLLRYIDERCDDVIFFADEAGSWQIGVEWDAVLPAWFGCLSRTVGPEEYARQVVQVVDEFDEVDRVSHFAETLRIASRSQCEALQHAVGICR